MKRNLYDNAFPTPAHQPRNDGMELRDYFAAKAMQALIINTDKESAGEADLWVGSMAYEVADAMMEARKQ